VRASAAQLRACVRQQERQAHEGRQQRAPHRRGTRAKRAAPRAAPPPAIAAMTLRRALSCPEGQVFSLPRLLVVCLNKGGHHSSNDHSQIRMHTTRLERCVDRAAVMHKTLTRRCCERTGQLEKLLHCW
jgi:hypothetical protein